MSYGFVSYWLPETVSGLVTSTTVAPTACPVPVPPDVVTVCVVAVEDAATEAVAADAADWPD